ncbi:MAG: hypothetical protein RLY70_3242, partial [Planctomycetota bacterium]
RLKQLAERCRAVELPEQAAATEQWWIERTSRRQTVFVADDPDPTRPAPGAPRVVAQWHAKFLEVRRTHAEALFEAARVAAGESAGGSTAESTGESTGKSTGKTIGEPTGGKSEVGPHKKKGSGVGGNGDTAGDGDADGDGDGDTDGDGDAAAAYRLLHEVLREAPDHAAARRILALGGSMDGPAVELSRPAFDHPKFGWRRGQHWRAESAHFVVSSNHSATVAQAAARELERLRQVWSQLFFGYWSSPAALRARFAGRDEPLGKKRRHQVAIFKTRDEYVAALRSSQPRIELSSGYYADTEAMSFLYAGDDAAHPTWRHEVVHQLFQEAGDSAGNAGQRGNMWLIEGIAVYFESLLARPGYAFVGGPDARRLQFARYAGLRGAVPLPFAELAALTREQLQSDARIRELYTQSAGLAHYLMDGDRGRWRPLVGRCLASIYAGRDTAGMLAELAGQPFSDFERGYLAFLGVDDTDLPHFAAVSEMRQLSLGRTAVTERGLLTLSAARQLEWLDLSFTPAADEGVAVFRHCTRLRQLFLERTTITDASLEWIGKLRELEELDLSGTKISDAGLKRLAGLVKLRTLYLTDCSVGDTGVDALRGLKRLETLDLGGTAVTPTGIERLRKSLPQWKP